MISEKTFNKWFNIFILAGMAVATVLMTAFKFHNAENGRILLIISALGSLAGVCSTVFSANGRILTFLFGVIDVSIYGVVCLIGMKFDNAALHLLYFLPMQLVGYLQWKQRGAGSGEQVRARRLNGKQWGRCILAVVGVSVFLFSVHYGMIRLGFQDKFDYPDMFSTVCNIIGLYLMSTAFMDQWFFWIGVNVFSVIMWSVSSEPYSMIYLIKYYFYLINSLNGLRIWLKLSRPEAK